MDAGACAQGSLDVSAAVMMSIGDILGSGVFASPGIVLANVHSAGAALASWLAGGIISFTGLLCLVELVVHSPDAGGVYAYLRMAFGDAFGFSWQFINFWCCVPGALAAQALTFAQYLTSFIPSARSESALSGDLNCPPPLSVKLIAFASISAVTAINCFSATIGGSAAKALTSLAMAGCILVVLLGAYAVFLPEPEDRTSWHHNLHDQPLGPTNLAGFGPAVISALWAFSGWADIAALAEELKEPRRNMPKVSGIALLTITITYVLMNAAYIAVVPAEQLAHESALGVTFAQIASGKQWPGLLVAAFVSASTMSSLHNNLFLSARQFWATARDGLFPSFLASTSAQSHAPLASVLTTSALSALLVCAANFRNLVDYLSLALWVYYGLLGVCVVVLRRRWPNAARPFKVPLYPVLPLLFTVACMYMALNTFMDNVVPCALSLLFVMLAFPVHALLHRIRAARTSRSLRTTDAMLENGSATPLLR